MTRPTDPLPPAAPRDDWSDDRLDAAFRARFDVEPPVHLVDLTHDAILQGRPDSIRVQPWPWRGLRSPHAAPLGGVAVVALLVVGAISVSLGGGFRPPVDDVESSSSAMASLGPRPNGFPTTAFGLSVETVEEALVVARTGSDEELAVRGWYEGRQGYFSCPAWSPTVPLLQPICGGSWWLMAQPESLADVSSETVLWHGPTGPAVSTVFATASPPPPNPLPSSGASTPIPVVFVGHFNDRRAALCPADAQAGCRSSFVVDAVAWVNGVEGGAQTIDRREATNPQPSPFLVPEVDAPSHFSGDARLLGMVILPGSRILGLEPALAHGDLRVSGQPTLWVVTVLVQAGEVTYPGASPVAAPARAMTLVYTAGCTILEDDGPGFRALPLRCPAELSAPGGPSVPGRLVGQAASRDRQQDPAGKVVAEEWRVLAA